MFSYWLNYQISQAPFGFHVTNVLIHLLNSFLIFFIVRKLLRPESSDWLLPGVRRGGLPAPSHPDGIRVLHRRPVGIVERVVFPGRLRRLFISAARRRSPGGPAIAVLVLFGAAAATKEHTVVLPALLLLTDYYWNPGFSFSRHPAELAALCPHRVGRGGRRWRSSREFWRTRQTAGFDLKEFTWYQYFFTQCRAFFVYLRLLVFPAGPESGLGISHLPEHPGSRRHLRARRASCCWRAPPFTSGGAIRWLLTASWFTCC